KLRDGRPWGVRLILAGVGAGTSALPFVLEDIEGRDLRIPRDAVRHANGVTGAAGGSVRTPDEQSFSRGLEAMGLAAAPRLGGVRRFSLARGWIEAAAAPDGKSGGMVSATFVRPGAAGGRLEQAEAAGLSGFLVTGSA